MIPAVMYHPFPVWKIVVLILFRSSKREELVRDNPYAVMCSFMARAIRAAMESPNKSLTVFLQTLQICSYDLKEVGIKVSDESL